MARLFYSVLIGIFGYKLIDRWVFSLFSFYWHRIAGKYRKNKNSDKKPRLFFGTTPIINSRYWSAALKEIGFDSKTVMSSYYEHINKKSDFDLIFIDIIENNYSWAPLFLRKNHRAYFLLDYFLKNFDVFHMPCTGAVLHQTSYEAKEDYFLKLFGCKRIIIPAGSDFYRYSGIIDQSWKHGMLYHYPNAARNEDIITQRFTYWEKNADIFFSGMQVDATGRWDLLPYSICQIDTDSWKPRKSYSDADGINKTVKILHSPNHRIIKGTEYLITAIERIKSRGIKAELILLEKKQNDEVRRIMQEEADILVEQLILGYGLNGIEGMACGLPVLSNLENESYTRLFRRYSHLNECPVLSTSPENIEESLLIMIRNPELRRQIGTAGRAYIEKYHSYKTAQFIFTKIYDKIWYNKNVDLLNMFHPLIPDSYNNLYPEVKHILVENKIPQELKSQLQQ
ncbi:MAG: glycosyltransferase [Cytophagaceae bacterium]|nr:glycosyltransferase [Cytophagaceae bacterium]